MKAIEYIKRLLGRPEGFQTPQERIEYQEMLIDRYKSAYNEARQDLDNANREIGRLEDKIALLEYTLNGTKIEDWHDPVVSINGYLCKGVVEEDPTVTIKHVGDIYIATMSLAMDSVLARKLFEQDFFPVEITKA